MKVSTIVNTMNTYNGYIQKINLCKTVDASILEKRKSIGEDNNEY